MEKRCQILPEPIVHIVDSDRAVCEGIQVLLRGMVDHVRAYPDAEAFLAGAPVDTKGCVIVEVNLPGISGLDLLEQLHERGIDLPVIVLASFSDVPMAVRAMRSGALDFIDKPFVDRVLRARVRQALACTQVSV